MSDLVIVSKPIFSFTYQLDWDRMLIQYQLLLCQFTIELHYFYSLW